MSFFRDYFQNQDLSLLFMHVRFSGWSVRSVTILQRLIPLSLRFGFPCFLSFLRFSLHSCSFSPVFSKDSGGLVQSKPCFCSRISFLSCPRRLLQVISFWYTMAGVDMSSQTGQSLLPGHSLAVLGPKCRKFTVFYRKFTVFCRNLA